MYGLSLIFVPTEMVILLVGLFFCTLGASSACPAQEALHNTCSSSIGFTSDLNFIQPTIPGGCGSTISLDVIGGKTAPLISFSKAVQVTMLTTSSCFNIPEANNTFHIQSTRYLLLMVDKDAPSQISSNGLYYLHWAVSDITVSLFVLGQERYLDLEDFGLTFHLFRLRSCMQEHS